MDLEQQSLKVGHVRFDQMSASKLEIVDHSDKTWQALTATCSQANIFHHAAWSSLMQECYGYHPFVAMVRDAHGNICAGLPMMEVNAKLPHRHWVSIPFSDHLREIADENQVVFIPPISDRELFFGMVKLARLFIFPSTHEGMSMMLLEAASLQVPIISSDIAENKIVMQDNALYFNSGDAIDLANQIQ